MRMRLFYELLMDDGNDAETMTDDRRARMRQLLTDTVQGAAAPQVDEPSTAGQVKGTRSAFVVGNNNTVVINLVLPSAEEAP
jgi:hypothetical protein